MLKKILTYFKMLIVPHALHCVDSCIFVFISFTSFDTVWHTVLVSVPPPLPQKFFYAHAYSKNSGRALSVTPVRPVRPSVRPSVRPYVPLSCPGHNSKTLWNIFMKLHRCIHHNKTMCHEQGRQLLHFWFLNYFSLT